jgi:Ca-activated chloride channel family protein
MRGRLVVIALALVAIVIAFAASHGGGAGKGGTTASAPANAIQVTFVHSTEKAALIKRLVDGFNAANVRSGGRVVQVRALSVPSGDAETRIAAGRLRPVVWSPASSLWGRLLNFDAKREMVAQDNPSLARTPLVIAMWETFARALGWPRQRVGWGQILRLARSPKGWALYGKTGFPAFKLGHTNPDFSTSGLSAVAGEYYAATGKREGLTLADVDRPAVRREIRDIEGSIVHYGDTTPFFSDQLLHYGPAFAQAVAMEETTLIDFNRRRGNRERLVALYPKDGTFFSDNPVAIVRAPWVTPALRAAGEAFSAWIRERATPAFVARFGFRPGDPDAKPAAPIDRAHGADPAQPEITLALPQPPVLSRIKKRWRQDRKPANVMLVVDTSSSMSQEGKMDQAKRGLRSFFGQLAPQDRVGLLTFSSRVRPVLPIARFSRSRKNLTTAVADMVGDGETALYDATLAGVRSVRRLDDTQRINAVVLLTDGMRTTGEVDLLTLLKELKSVSPVEERTVRIFAISYGADAAVGPLKEIAAATGGKWFPGNPHEIGAVYQSISSFF